jgi:hypothetical protein
MRRWVKRTVVVVWLATATLVFLATRMHPTTLVNVSLIVREISFKTNLTEILSPAVEEQLILSRVAAIHAQGTNMAVDVGADHRVQNVLDIEGDPSATCSFYNVRSGVINLTGDALLTLRWSEQAGRASIALISHGPVNGSLTAQPTQGISGFSCARSRVDGGGAVGDIEGRFSSEDSVYFTTATDSQVDFRLREGSNIGDTQIPVVGNIRLAHIDPSHPGQEKTVLLAPMSGQSNEILFERLSRTVRVDESDLLLIRPGPYFYIRRFSVDNGIRLSLHGSVHDVSMGAGPDDMRTVMPTLFDQLDNKSRVFAVVPAIVVVLLGILEKLGILRRE